MIHALRQPAGCVAAQLGPLSWQEPPPAVAVNLHGRGPRSTRALQELQPTVLLTHADPGKPGPEWDTASINVLAGSARRSNRCCTAPLRTATKVPHFDDEPALRSKQRVGPRNHTHDVV